MEKNYQKRNLTSPTYASKISSKLALIVVTFFLGYFSASFLEIKQVGAWLNSLTSTHNASIVTAQATQQKSQLPKPKLEFYTLLTTEHANNIAVPPPPPPVTPTHVALATAEPQAANTVNATTEVHGAPVTATTTTQPNKAATQPVLTNRLAYTIQVAAFRSRQDAEHMKASLLLKGFDANVYATESQNVSWFRVVVGPFSSRALAEQTQSLLVHRERVSGMIRKVEV